LKDFGALGKVGITVESNISVFNGEETLRGGQDTIIGQTVEVVVPKRRTPTSKYKQVKLKDFSGAGKRNKL
jgi:hypothetical protein